MTTQLKITIAMAALMLAGQMTADASDADRVQVPFSYSRSGHLLITAKIGGKSACFIVDSGAQMSVIHSKQAKHLGLSLKKGSHSVGGVDGGVMSSSSVEVPSIRFERTNYKKPAFMAVDLSHVEPAAGNKKLCGLIGSDFLTKHGAIIDFRNKTLSLRRPAAPCFCLTSLVCAGAEKRIEVPFTTTESGHIIIAAKINKIDTQLGVDTAAGVNLIAQKQAGPLGLKLERSRQKIGGLGGQGMDVNQVNVPSITIGGINYFRPDFIAVDLSHAARSAETHKLGGVIGSGFLRKHGAVIDYEQKTISFDKP